MDIPRRVESLMEMKSIYLARNPLFNLLMYEMNKNSTFKFMIKEGHRQN